MANQPFTGGIRGPDGKPLPEKAIDLGDGTFARQSANLSLSSTGTVQDGLPPGRAAATASVPTVLSNEDYARLGQTYRRAAAVGATAGDAVIVSGVTTAGTITLTLVNGGTATVNVPLGSTILPFAVTAAALGTAVGGTFQSLFFT